MKHEYEILPEVLLVKNIPALGTAPFLLLEAELVLKVISIIIFLIAKIFILSVIDKVLANGDTYSDISNFE